MENNQWRLRARIVELYGNQWRFAQAVGMHESDVSRVLRGRKALDEEKREIWAQALKLDSLDMTVNA